MTRVSLFTSPLMLGFDELERLVERSTKASDSYPPYNIERSQNGSGEAWRITLAVAGFAREDLEITVEDRQLVVKGRQKDEPGRDYLHRGIAARQFVRSFVLADGMEVLGADMGNGLLAINLRRNEPEKRVRRIEISE
ncbi:MAG: Hsp20 family protein [Proteobacteria bacterium]|nr:Hsp20 family protein [Pseudomonadota bacterium]